MSKSSMNERQKLGPRTAKGGFKNERQVVEKINNYVKDEDAHKWLEIMGYDYKII